MKLADYDYNLPEALIPQFPLQHRDASRLMVINRHTREISHAQFSKIGEFLPPRSLLVLNDTKVMPARLIGEKLPTGGKIELLLIRPKGERIWETLVRPSRRVSRGTRLVFGQGVLTAQIRQKMRMAFASSVSHMTANSTRFSRESVKYRCRLTSNVNPTLEIENGINVSTLRPKALSPPQQQGSTSHNPC